MFTKSGLAIAIAAVVLLAVGWVADYPELVLLAFAGIAVLVVAVLWILSRPDLSAVREIRPRRVSAGERAVGVVTVTNQARHRSLPIMAIEEVASTRTAQITKLSIPVPSLAAGEFCEASYSLPTQRRDIYQVGPLTVGHTDPLRLMAGGRKYETWSRLVVHPRIQLVEPIPTSHTRDTDGATSSYAPQGGIAFHSLRDYELGDDQRLIHWKSTARMGRFMVRHNVVPHEPRLMVVLDTSVSPYDEKSFEDAVSAAASLCVAAIRGGFPLQLRTTAKEAVAVDRAGDGIGAVLDMLAGVQRSDGDQGLAVLPGVVPRDETITLAVITGQPRVELLALLPTVRPRVPMVNLIQFADERTAPLAALGGIVSVTVGRNEEFAAVWNHLVRR
ncbi:MAG: DUF58 domain-containing protein [Actinomycetota bacterium]|nr:DUF58 domain-containing protein [Actinomycetota bacterium]